MIKDSEYKQVYDKIESKIISYPSNDGKRKPYGDGKKYQLYRKCANCSDNTFCAYNKMAPLMDNTTQRGLQHNSSIP